MELYSSLILGSGVVCIQETKANPAQLSPELLGPGGIYNSYFSSAKRPGYSGTAIFSKTQPDPKVAKFLVR